MYRIDFEKIMVSPYKIFLMMLCALLCGVTILSTGCGKNDSSATSTVTPLNISSPNNSGEPNPSSVASPTELSLAPRVLRLAPGATHTLRLMVKRNNGQSEDITRAAGVSYRSSASSIVTVSSDGILRAVESASTGSIATVEASYAGLRSEVQILVHASLRTTIIQQPNSIPVVTNPLDLAVVVNKSRALAADYIPPDLVYVKVPFSTDVQSEKQQLREAAAQALEKMFADAKQSNIELVAISGYRSYLTQKHLFDYNVKTKGLEEASRFVAQPGLSEHQTGLAIDVSSANNKFALTESFADTVEGQWLASHAAEYGFIIRYPKDKELLTGYAYEPWHIRYVGDPLAKQITDSGLTFEQYFEQVESTPVSSN